MRVIADEGLDAVTHRRVAAEAGISYGSITYWFESRRELVDAAFRSYLEDTSTFLADLGATVTVNTPESVIDYLVEVSRQEFADPRMVLAEYELILAAARDPELATAYAEWQRSLISGLAEALERIGASRPFEAARALQQLLRGFEVDRLTRPEADEDELRRSLRVALPALLADWPSKTETDPAETGSLRGGPRATAGDAETFEQDGALT